MLLWKDVEPLGSRLLEEAGSLVGLDILTCPTCPTMQLGLPRSTAMWIRTAANSYCHRVVCCRAFSTTTDHISLKEVVSLRGFFSGIWLQQGKYNTSEFFLYSGGYTKQEQKVSAALCRNTLEFPSFSLLYFICGCTSFGVHYVHWCKFDAMCIYVEVEEQPRVILSRSLLPCFRDRVSHWPWLAWLLSKP